MLAAYSANKATCVDFNTSVCVKTLKRSLHFTEHRSTFVERCLVVLIGLGVIKRSQHLPSTNVERCSVKF